MMVDERTIEYDHSTRLEHEMKRSGNVLDPDDNGVVNAFGEGPREKMEVLVLFQYQAVMEVSKITLRSI
jgi:hypothetical protein